MAILRRLPQLYLIFSLDLSFLKMRHAHIGRGRASENMLTIVTGGHACAGGSRIAHRHPGLACGRSARASYAGGASHQAYLRCGTVPTRCWMALAPCRSCPEFFQYECFHLIAHVGGDAAVDVEVEGESDRRARSRARFRGE